MRVIAGTARRILLRTLPGENTRPTTDRIKETLFNILMSDIPGCRFLDLFAGSGAIGIEALSRGASAAVFIEQNRAAAECIRANLKSTHLEEKAMLLVCDAAAGIGRLHGQEPFDVIFMDPPYGQKLEKRVLEAIAQSNLTVPDTRIIIEASLETDPADFEGNGFEISRVKTYKTNQHVFLKHKTAG